MMLRQIALDTETTGLEAQKGHRIIEIGCVELINRRLTGNNFHTYINPEREIDAGAVQIHGITNAFLADKPTFAAVLPQFKAYVDGAQLIIHNAPFDTGFLNAEFKLCDKKLQTIDRYCSIIDTLAMARKKHPGQKNSLDALCKRYGVDNSHRQLHGGLLDADLLARLYLAMTGGQIDLFGMQGQTDNAVEMTVVEHQKLAEKQQFKVVKANAEELAAHTQRVAQLVAKSRSVNLWERDN